MQPFALTAVLLLLANVAGAATPVLRVNQTTMTDVELDLARQAVQAMTRGTQMDEATLLRHAVDQLVARALLLQAAQAAGLKVDAAAAEQAVRAQAARMGGEEQFTRSLAEAKLDRATLVRIEGERQLIARYVEKVLAAGIEISDDDARLYYEVHPAEFKHPPQVKLRMVLVEVSPQASPEAVAAARAKAEAALARVRTGEDFGAVAREVSTDATGQRGGELGWVRAGMLLPELEPKVWALQAGEVSDVLRSPNGFHVFKVEARRGEGVSPFEEVRDRLKAFLRQRTAQEGVQAKVDELRATATIEGLTAEVKQALARPGGS
ncbi:MAG: peptidylprolyl isomerase [Acidobacteriota bacterium]|jgi:parvulin-like peptidyl-prolyl isomerase